MINRNNVKCTQAWPSLVDEKLWTHAGPDVRRRVCTCRIVRKRLFGQRRCDGKWRAMSFTKPDSRLIVMAVFYFTHLATVLETCTKHNFIRDLGKSGPACVCYFFFFFTKADYIYRDTKHHNPFFYESKLKWTVSESFPDSPSQCWKPTLAIRLSWEQCQTLSRRI